MKSPKPSWIAYFENAITNIVNTLVFLYLHVHTLFHRIPAYSDNDRNSIHIQKHSQYRSCKDRFHMATADM